jgi:putative aminopeptidase
MILEDMMEIERVLERFMTTPAVSGYENEMALALTEELTPYADDIRTDKIGNVIARIAGTEKDTLKVMIYAHIDQLGFIVRKIEDDGFIQVDRLGGIPEKVLPGLQVSIRTRTGKYIDGVIGMKSHHATSPEEKYKVDFVTKLHIDIGAASAKQVREAGIEIGCPALYKPRFTKLMGDLVAGTAADDRGGCAALVKIASILKEKRPAVDVYLVGTVWEEFNLRGAMIAARTVKPDIAVCLDVMLAGDTSDLKAMYEDKVGNGPCLGMYSFHGRGTLNGTLPHAGLVALTEKTASEEKINLQYFAGLGILTDSSYLQLENDGVASIELGYPARYTHTPVELCSMGDLLKLSELAAGMIHRLDRNFSLNRY